MDPGMDFNEANRLATKINTYWMREHGVEAFAKAVHELDTDVSNPSKPTRRGNWTVRSPMQSALPPKFHARKTS